MMDCTDITRFLHAYIDQEFEHREVIEFEHHLSHCDSCRAEVAYYRTLRQTVAQQVERRVAPRRLEANILHALEEEERGGFSWFSLSLATAGAFLCAMGIFFWAPAVQDNLPASQRYSKVETRAKAPLAVRNVGTKVFAPLSVRKVPRRQFASLGHSASPPNNAAGTLNTINAHHAAQAALHSTQRPQSCVEHNARRIRNGWFITAGESGLRPRLQKAHNALDDLCDPRRANPSRPMLIRANYQR